MKIGVVSVGRPDRGPTGDLFDAYAERIRRLGVEFDARFVREVRPGSRFSDAHVREREARALTEALPERGCVVALTPRGRSLTTEAFAALLPRWAVPEITFVIGGPLGLDPAFERGAAVCLALSPMTLPHELARAILAEQIYRAMTILRRLPYHK